MKAALEGGVHLRSGVKVKSVDTAKTAIVLENGDIVSADVIIAADGVHVGGKLPIFSTSCLLTMHSNSVCRSTLHY